VLKTTSHIAAALVASFVATAAHASEVIFKEVGHSEGGLFLDYADGASTGLPGPGVYTVTLRTTSPVEWYVTFTDHYSYDIWPGPIDGAGDDYDIDSDVPLHGSHSQSFKLDLPDFYRTSCERYTLPEFCDDSQKYYYFGFHTGSFDVNAYADEPFDYKVYAIRMAEVPEPLTWTLLLGGMFAIGRRLRAWLPSGGRLTRRSTQFAAKS
jgi:hypothetical protein